MSWQAEAADARAQPLIERAEEQQWEWENFPEPTRLIQRQDREYRNELARLEQVRLRREREARSV